MSVGKICDELSSRLEELESVWKEAKETIRTPRLTTPTASSMSGPPSRQQSFSAFSGGRERAGLQPRSASPSSSSNPAHRRPSATNVPFEGHGDKESKDSGSSPSLIRSVPVSSNRGSALSAARVAKEPSLARSSVSPARGVSPSRSAGPRGTGAGSGAVGSGVSGVGRPRNVSPSRPLSPSTAARRFTFEPTGQALTSSSVVPGGTTSSSRNEPEVSLMNGSKDPFMSANTARVPVTPTTTTQPQSDSQLFGRASAGVSSGGQRFCHHCGYDLRPCKIPPKFCRECGTRINTTPTPEVF